MYTVHPSVVVWTYAKAACKIPLRLRCLSLSQALQGHEASKAISPNETHKNTIVTLPKTNLAPGKIAS